MVREASGSGTLGSKFGGDGSLSGDADGDGSLSSGSLDGSGGTSGQLSGDSVGSLSGVSNEFLVFDSSGNIVTSGYTSGDFAPATHFHPASDITSGTFDDARIAQSNVFQFVDDTASNLNTLLTSSEIDSRINSNIGSSDLGDLDNVTETSSASGEFIRYDGSNWANTLLSASDIPNLDASKITTGQFADARISESSVTQHESAINHNNLTNYVGNEHINHTSVSYSGGEGISGSGDLTQGTTFDLALDSLTAETTLGTLDRFVFYDNNAGTHKKIEFSDFEGEINHNNLLNVGTNSHSDIDSHIADGTIHFTEGSIRLTGIGEGITSPNDGEVVIYDGANSEFENRLLVESDIPNLSAGKITSGTFADARIAESNVTQHEEALTITESQISDLTHYTSSDFDTDFGNKTTDDLDEGTNDLYFTDERAQDAVGNILTDTSSISFTYDDATPEITATVLESGVDHNSLNNYAQNEHRVWENSITQNIHEDNITELSVTQHESALNLYNQTNQSNALIYRYSDNQYSGGDDASIYSNKYPITIQENTNQNGWPGQYGQIVTYWSASDRAKQYWHGAGSSNDAYFREVHPASYPDWSDWNKIWAENDFTSTDISNWDTAYSERGSQIAGTNLTWNGSQLDATDTNTQLSKEEVQDFAWDVLGGTQTLINVTYDDTNDNVDFVVNDDLSQYDNSTSGFFNQSSDINHDDTSGYVANEHIDWTTDQGSTNINDANITQSAITQHESALTITESQITDANFSDWDTAYSERITDISGSGNGTVTLTKPDSTDETADLSHTHTWSELSDVTAALSDINSINQELSTTSDVNFNDGTFGGNVSIAGDLTVSGDKFKTYTETVEIGDNLGIINFGETGAGVTEGFAGWEVDRGTNDPYRWGFEESSGYWKIGQYYTDLTYSGLLGTFNLHEEIVGGSSGAKAYIVSDSSSTLRLKGKTGSFTNTETITGQDSGATATVDSTSITDELQAVATRQDSPTNNALAFWNSTDMLFETSSNLTWDGTDLSIGGSNAIVVGDNVSDLNNDGEYVPKSGGTFDDRVTFSNSNYGFHVTVERDTNSYFLTLLDSGDAVIDMRNSGDGQIRRRTSVDYYTMWDDGNVSSGSNIDITGRTISLTGTIPRGNLPSEIAYEDESNTFSQDQTVNATVSANEVVAPLRVNSRGSIPTSDVLPNIFRASGISGFPTGGLVVQGASGDSDHIIFVLGSSHSIAGQINASSGGIEWDNNIDAPSLSYDGQDTDNRYAPIAEGGSNIAGTNLTWDGSNLNATDTDTTYTDGAGLDLSGTTFSLSIDTLTSLGASPASTDLIAIHDSSASDHKEISYSELESGLTITESQITGANFSNWDTAYSWGDHSQEGYLTDITGEVIGDLSNVSTGTLSSGDFLRYDGSNFVNTTISANDVPNHDNLNGFVSNEHIDHSTVSISSGTGLSGGGDLTASRTLSLDASVADLNDASGKTGLDSNLVSGTAGTSGNFIQWNADGDAVDSGNSVSDFVTAAAGSDHQIQYNNGGNFGASSQFFFNDTDIRLAVGAPPSADFPHSTIHSGRSIAVGPHRVENNEGDGTPLTYTADENDGIIVADPQNGNISINLPPPGSVRGRFYFVGLYRENSNDVIISSSSGIRRPGNNDASSVSLPNDLNLGSGDMITIFAQGDSWFILS